MWCQLFMLIRFVCSQELRFEMLAFKSDVSHWRKKDELTGVSLRYVSLAWIPFTTVNSNHVERWGYTIPRTRCGH